MENSKIVAGFIEQIWNRGNFEKLDDFLHPEFKDHSLPAALTPDKEGIKKWILGTSSAFEHHTTIQDQVTEADKSMLRIKMEMKHIGPWRGIEPTGIEIAIQGYRQYRLKDGKIIEHWALIDGHTLEHQLKNQSL